MRSQRRQMGNRSNNHTTHRSRQATFWRCGRFGKFIVEFHLGYVCCACLYLSKIASKNIHSTNAGHADNSTDAPRPRSRRTGHLPPPCLDPSHTQPRDGPFCPCVLQSLSTWVSSHPHPAGPSRVHRAYRLRYHRAAHLFGRHRHSHRSRIDKKEVFKDRWRRCGREDYLANHSRRPVNRFYLILDT